VQHTSKACCHHFNVKQSTCMQRWVGWLLPIEQNLVAAMLQVQQQCRHASVQHQSAHLLAVQPPHGCTAAEGTPRTVAGAAKRALHGSLQGQQAAAPPSAAAPNIIHLPAAAFILREGQQHSSTPTMCRSSQ
jgi:hypothetical protein